MKLVVCALLLAGLAFVSAEEEGRKSYRGYHLVDIVPKTAEHTKFLHDLMIKEVHFDFWTEPGRRLNEVVTINVNPRQFIRLEVMLRKQGIEFDVREEDVQSLLDPMWAELDARKNAKGGMVFDINDFNTIDDINAWLQVTANNCPSSINCRVYSVGQSFNGRPINVFHISRAGSGRKAYWIDATIHAREWIATATALKVIDNFARLADGNAVSLTTDYDWYIMPVMNPDGYAYTHTNDRLWRKNRRPNPGSICYGTDLNRNFNFRWGTDGVSHVPCSDIYCGPNGGSEPETIAVSDELRRLGPNLLATVTVHSYGNMWMFPWGNTVNFAGQTCDIAADHNDMMIVANAAANAVEATYNTRWERGNSCVVIYETTGGTDDYAKGAAGVKYAFCPELRGNNFVIAASNITPSFNEFWAGIVAMARTING